MLITNLLLASSLAFRTQLLYLLYDLSSNVIKIVLQDFFFLCSTNFFLWNDDFMLFAAFWSRILLIIYTVCSHGLNHALDDLEIGVK